MQNPIIKDHFLNPRNMGVIENPTHHAVVKSETCSDVVKMTLIVRENDLIEDIRTQVYGCGYAIAGTSIFNAIATGKKVAEVRELAIKFINGLLPAVPETNKNCIQLALKVFEKIFKPKY